MTYSNLLQQIIEAALPQLHHLPTLNFNEPPSPTKWSKKQILGHLIDSAYNNHQRFLRAEAQGDLIFQGYDQDEWVRLNNYQNRDKEEVINTWFAVNQHLAHLIASIPEEVMNRMTTEHNFHKVGMVRPEEREPASLGYLVWDYIFHLEHHLAQILPDYEKQLGAFEENAL